MTLDDILTPDEIGEAQAERIELEQSSVVEVFELDKELVNPVYRPHLNNTARTQIYYGGSSSGKSYFLAQRCVNDLLNNGRNYLCVRKVGDTLRDSVYSEIENAARSLGVHHRFRFTVSPMQIVSDVGTVVLFRGLDKVEKVKSIRPKSGALTDIWVEEATEAVLQEIGQLRKRQRGGDTSIPKRLTLSFNPIYQTHPIFTEYFASVGWQDDQTYHEGESLTILKTTYKDNQFLAPDDIAELEGETDKYLYEVYTLGNWGSLGAVIFTNWKIVDLSEQKKEFDNLRDGLDFGFGGHPAGYAGMHLDSKRKKLYVFEDFYRYGATNPELAGILQPIVKGRAVLADSAEPKSIQELRDEGINAIGAKKGQGSINFGIQYLKQFEILIDKDCIDTQNEFRLYQWATDRQGNRLNRPTDKHNHIIDAMRYGLSLDMAQEPIKGKKAKRVQRMTTFKPQGISTKMKGRF